MPRQPSTPPIKTRGPTSVLADITVERRAGFGGGPDVGAKGTRTQQRILRAALDVFGEGGYHRCRVEHITKAAGCSRPTFYQYFSSKEELFRQLALEVARALFAVIDDMAQVTPDEEGWDALRAFLAAHSELYEHYWPVFGAFAAAAGSDDTVLASAQRVGQRQFHSLTAKIDPSAFRSVPPDVVSTIVLNAINRANRYVQLIARIAPERAPERDRFLDSFTDLLHRSLFGRRGVVRARTQAAGNVPSIEESRAEFATLNAVPAHIGLEGQRTRTRILDVGAAHFANHGYHEASIENIVADAGVSRGTFYIYFENKDEVFRRIAARSSGRVFEAVAAYPAITTAPSTSRSARQLTRWLTGYAQTWAEEGKIFRIWMEAMGSDGQLLDATIRVIGLFRSALVGFLADREFGDTETDAFLLLALLDFGAEGLRSMPMFEHTVDAVATVIRRGFFGVDARF